MGFSALKRIILLFKSWSLVELENVLFEGELNCIFLQ